MAVTTKATSKTTKDKELVCVTTQTVISTRASGTKINV